MTSLAHQDHQVPGGGDDDALPVYCRFNDIRDAGICTSWVQFARLIEKEAFPPGISLSANTRVWAVSKIRAWLARRPAATTTKEVA